MNKILIFLLTILLAFCQPEKNKEFRGFKTIEIIMGEKHHLNIQNNQILSDKLVENIINAKKIKGPVKGIGIGIILSKASDTIQILTYGRTKYFKFKGEYYKSRNNLLPDSIVNKFIH